MGHITGMAQAEKLACGQVEIYPLGRTNGLSSSHIPSPDMGSLRQRLRAHGARISEIYSGFTAYYSVITASSMTLYASTFSFV